MMLLQEVKERTTDMSKKQQSENAKALAAWIATHKPLNENEFWIPNGDGTFTRVYIPQGDVD